MFGGDELSDDEHETLLELCRERLDDIREQRGEGVFSQHSPISSTVKYNGL